MPATGSCLCNAITFEVNGPLRPVVNCHCTQCRKWTGHFGAATAVWKQDLKIHDPQGKLAWFRSSDRAQRGFCKRCGSSLLWQSDVADTTTIFAGTLNGATGLKTEAQIYVHDKGDYYTLSDPQAPTFAQSGHSVQLNANPGID